ncbi:TIGR03086 family metal-binding protein [Streptomyces sp. DH37]|uniref:TIGR03086 family metal-binding protein n=1 Tax=Streptomyces sp. DH37 TaxID=3040122 RepID=UPI002441D0AF|nr:TIGR03086 family metal-binding protein [Streptomyces sp. DH37]MDG9705501.1 TIGR03086 family metal-binding protein [Streptomyces sp. DH37]
MTDMLDLEPPARRMALVLEGVGDERLPAPTPCEGVSVGDLLHHVLGLSVAFRDAARKELGPTTRTDPASSRPSAALLPADWRGAVPRALDELVAAWRDPAAWEGTTQAGGVTLPAAVAGHVALNELLIHGWDIARATGQAYDCDEASLRASIGLLSQSTDEAERAGTFGPVVEVPGDAPLLDRAVGLSGRRPSWTPGPERTPDPGRG